eukprot:scaffold5610_cov157-Amphora_coffeaeformis.AAC.2
MATTTDHKHPTSNGDGAHAKHAETDQDKEETADKTDNKPTVKEFIENFRLSKLIDPNEPWVLMEEGSFLGYFDWVPRELRVGPWSVAAICYLFAIPYAAALAFMHFGQNPWASIHHSQVILQYPAVGSPEWTYNLVIVLWIVYVNYLVIIGPLSYRAWATYTVQSWTLLWMRHGLCVLAPWAPWAARWAEYTRFPMICSATVTFVVWNVILMPVIYQVGMKTPEKKKGFLKFCFSFRLLQLHGFNIVYCIINVLWASPARQLETLDLLAALASVLVYMMWYLCCMDRLGIHFYPIFSPRIGWLVVISWTSAFLLYMGIFFGWQRIFQAAVEAKGSAA